jgi:hypothetical protein
VCSATKRRAFLRPDLERSFEAGEIGVNAISSGVMPTPGYNTSFELTLDEGFAEI